MRYLIVIGALALTSCTSNGSNETLSPDVIVNPVSASGETDTTMVAAMDFDEILYDFGTISQGEKASHTYTFTNTGKVDLVITTAKGSCGCTVPDYPRQPIAPGESGEIEVVFNSEGKSGKQHKKIYIVANTNPETNTLAITGTVTSPELNWLWIQ